MVVEEPDLGEHERDCRQRDGDPAPGEDDQRHEPDEVLRREDLREGEETGHGAGKRER